MFLHTFEFSSIFEKKHSVFPTFCYTMQSHFREKRAQSGDLFHALKWDQNTICFYISSDYRQFFILVGAVTLFHVLYPFHRVPVMYVHTFVSNIFKLNAIQRRRRAKRSFSNRVKRSGTRVSFLNRLVHSQANQEVEIITSGERLVISYLVHLKILGVLRTPPEARGRRAGNHRAPSSSSFLSFFPLLALSRE